MGDSVYGLVLGACGEAVGGELDGLVEGVDSAGTGKEYSIDPVLQTKELERQQRA